MKEVVVPLPVELLRQIDELARQNERSRVAQIRFLLRRALELPSPQERPEQEPEVPRCSA